MISFRLGFINFTTTLVEQSSTMLFLTGSITRDPRVVDIAGNICLVLMEVPIAPWRCDESLNWSCAFVIVLMATRVVGGDVKKGTVEGKYFGVVWMVQLYGEDQTWRVAPLMLH